MKDYNTYAKMLRKRFSNTNMLKSNNDINQNYFRCKFGEFWNEEDYTKLRNILEAMENKTDYDKIKEYFPNLNTIEIRLRIRILNAINKQLV